MNHARNEDAPPYGDGITRDADNLIIEEALAILHRRLQRNKQLFVKPSDVKDYLRLQLAQLDHEVFCIMFLDAQHGLISCDHMFRGTLAQTSVYPREVVKAALGYNAGAVILAHNHPSGNATPSRADEMLTQSLKSALALVDVRVLDHIVVGADETVSFAERGLL